MRSTRLLPVGGLLILGSLLFLPNLGKPSLWDIDEGHNAEAAVEMLESGNWIVPTFNYELRVDKPALLYWLQIAGYRWLGVSEFTARLPSALAALLSLLLAFQLGRDLFGTRTGLGAGLILASTLGFAASAHFANPDALLHLTTACNLWCFWRWYTRSTNLWLLGAAAGAGLAVLAKGPVGLVLPGAVSASFLVWSGSLGRLLDRRWLQAVGIFLLIALPWYVWVAVDTKANFLRGFIMTHNVGRFLSPMEHHGGPPYYYLGVLLLGFAPWSIFLGPAVWCSTGSRARLDGSLGESRLPPAYRFLWCWVGVYLIFFTVASTKLPNYILPAYTPLAVLTGRTLERWRQGEIIWPAWLMPVCLGSLALLGLSISAGLLVAGGTMAGSLLHGRVLPGLASGAVLGLVVVAGAIAAAWCCRRHWRTHALGVIGAAGAGFTGLLFAWGSVALDEYKAPRTLVESSGARRLADDVRVASYLYWQPSLVFYCGREVQRLDSEARVREFLAMRLPAYLFMPADTWSSLQSQGPMPGRLLARHFDFYRHCEVVVVGNR